MSNQELTPQEPGVIAGTDQDKLAQLAEGPVGDIVAALDALSDGELDQIAAMERAGKGRTSALDAIAREQQQREAGKQEPFAADQVGIERSSLGDADSYAKMRAHEINQDKISRPVLTLDGWLLPRPSASPEG